MANTINVQGSYGDFDVEISTGRIVTSQKDMPKEYKTITKVDMDEWRSWMESIGHKKEADEMEGLDILEVGYWYNSKHGETRYEHPEDDFRNHLVKVLSEREG